MRFRIVVAVLVLAGFGLMAGAREAPTTKTAQASTPAVAEATSFLKDAEQRYFDLTNKQQRAEDDCTQLSGANHFGHESPSDAGDPFQSRAGTFHGTQGAGLARRPCPPQMAPGCPKRLGVLDRRDGEGRQVRAVGAPRGKAVDVHGRRRAGNCADPHRVSDLRELRAGVGLIG